MEKPIHVRDATATASPPTTTADVSAPAGDVAAAAVRVLPRPPDLHEQAQDDCDAIKVLEVSPRADDARLQVPDQAKATLTPLIPQLLGVESELLVNLCVQQTEGDEEWPMPWPSFFFYWPRTSSLQPRQAPHGITLKLEIEDMQKELQLSSVQSNVDQLILPAPKATEVTALAFSIHHSKFNSLLSTRPGYSLHDAAANFTLQIFGCCAECVWGVISASVHQTRQYLQQWDPGIDSTSRRCIQSRFELSAFRFVLFAWYLARLLGTIPVVALPLCTSKVQKQLVLQHGGFMQMSVDNSRVLNGSAIHLCPRTIPENCDQHLMVLRSNDSLLSGFGFLIVEPLQFFMGALPMITEYSPHILSYPDGLVDALGISMQMSLHIVRHLVSYFEWEIAWLFVLEQFHRNLAWSSEFLALISTSTLHSVVLSWSASYPRKYGRELPDNQISVLDGIKMFWRVPQVATDGVWVSLTWDTCIIVGNFLVSVIIVVRQACDGLKNSTADALRSITAFHLQHKVSELVSSRPPWPPPNCSKRNSFSRMHNGCKSNVLLSRHIEFIWNEVELFAIQVQSMAAILMRTWDP